MTLYSYRLIRFAERYIPPFTGGSKVKCCHPQRFIVKYIIIWHLIIY